MATPDAALDLSLVDVLARVEARGALFTTFTLSLSWFEVHLLRHLEQAGAQRVAVLADPVGLEQTLSEGLAGGPGLRYALDAVVMPRGVFHPKVALVWGDDSLVLAVGSGNLTLPGMQRNLEVLDILGHGVGVPERHQLTQEVASGLLGFLREVRERLDSGAFSRVVLAEAIGALEARRSRLPSRSSPRWLDTLQHSAGAQLVAALPPAGADRRLAVLSPFHHGKGASVRRLALELGAQTVELLFHGDGTTFPIRAGRGWDDVAFHTRRLQRPDASRALHAKVYRVIDGQRSWVCTGSVNATEQALWTTRNMEVALLREGERGDFDTLLRSRPGRPTQLDQEPFEGRAHRLLIRSARARGGAVEVRLEAPLGAPRSLQLRFVGEDAPAFDGAWPAGAVRIGLPAAFDALHPDPCRVEATADFGEERVVVRAWVAFDSWLEASPRWRRAALAWNRLLADPTDPDEEDADLLRIFGEEHHAAIGHLSRKASGGSGAGRSKVADDVPVPVKLLLAAAAAEAERSGPAAGLSGGVSASHLSGALRAMLRAFRRLDSLESGDDDDDDEAPRVDPLEDGPRRAPLKRRVREALEHFESQLVVACHRLQGKPPQPEQVLVYLSLCVRLAMRYRERDATYGPMWESLRGLLGAVLAPRRGGPPVLSELDLGRLEPEAAETFVTGLALLAWHLDGGRLGEEAALQVRREWLRECLATLERSTDVLPGPAWPEQLAALASGREGELKEAFARLEHLPAPSHKATWLVEQVRALRLGKADVNAIARNAREAGHPLSRDERLMFGHLTRGVKAVVVTPWQRDCRCKKGLPTTHLAVLRRREVLRCEHCGRWLIVAGGA